MSDITDELVRLGELREKGLITQEEFDAAKAKLLGQSADAGSSSEQPPEMPPPTPPQSRPSALRPPPSDDIPPGIKGWSWGAFLWNWIWAIFNNTWIGLLALIPGVNLVMIFVLGAKGREWAWKNKKWDSVEHFNRVQRKWTLWGVWLMLAGLVLAILVMVASFLFIGMAGSKATTDFMEAMPTPDVTDSSVVPEESATPATEESSTEAVAEDAAPAVAEDAVTTDTSQAEPEADYTDAATDTAATDAAAEQAAAERAELARIKAEADAAKAEAAKAKKDALKAEKALAEQRRRQEEERRAAEEQAAREEEEMQCPYSRSQPLTCSSRQGQPAYCDWNFKACGNPRISKKESKTTCDGKVNWDTDSNQLIVTEGCRAQFVPVQ